MTLIHSHRKEDPFVRLDKRIVFDNQLSWKAKGILAYAFSRPDDWSFYKKELLRHSKDGEASLDSGLEELENAKYLHREKKRDEKTGRFDNWDWHFFEVPMTDEEFKKFSPQGDFPAVEKSSPVKSPPTKNDSLNKTDSVLSVRECKDKISKKNQRGESVSCSLDKIFSDAVMQKKDWKTNEIKEAWGILFDYQGAVSDPLKFIEGTIVNIRNKQKREESCSFQKKQKATSGRKEYSEMVAGMSEPRLPNGKSLGDQAWEQGFCHICVSRKGTCSCSLARLEREKLSSAQQ